MRKWWIALVAVLLVLGAGGVWYFESPWWTLRQMKAAAEAGDLATLSSYVDTAALEADARAQFAERFRRKAPGELRGVEKLLVGAMAAGLAAGVANPEGLKALFTHEAGKRTPFGLHAEDLSVVHDGLDQFRLVSKQATGAALVFRRHGLGWKLSGVTIPEDFHPLAS
jgi:hypothetical protein